MVIIGMDGLLEFWNNVTLLAGADLQSVPIQFSGKWSDYSEPVEH